MGTRQERKEEWEFELALQGDSQVRRAGDSLLFCIEASREDQQNFTSIVSKMVPKYDRKMPSTEEMAVTSERTEYLSKVCTHACVMHTFVYVFLYRHMA